MKKKNPCTLIFMGISGCGKGTQIREIVSFLGENYPQNKIKVYESGKRLVKLSEENNTLGNSVRRLLHAGKLSPDSVVNSLVEEFLMELNHDEFCIFDGYPRTKAQAINLDNALHSHYRQDPVIVIHLNVSEATAISRLVDRAKMEERPDDSSIDSISERIGWFEKDVEPALKFYKESKGYLYFEINGDKDAENVSADILEALSPYIAPLI